MTLACKSTMEEDNRRSIMLMPPDAMRRKLRKLMPDLDDDAGRGGDARRRCG